MSNETKYPKISIESRIESELGTVPIHWPGREIDLDGVTAWIQPEILGYSGAPSRLSERFELWTIQFNCFARTGAGMESTHKVWELVDMCIAAFDQVTMAVVNWAAEDPKPTLYYMRFGEADVTRISPPEEIGKLVQQQTVSFEGLIVAA